MLVDCLKTQNKGDMFNLMFYLALNDFVDQPSEIEAVGV